MLGSASDMIGHLPFVTGSDGNYTVIGRGKPEIYINGRKVRDTSELNQLQANEILSAEIVTRPEHVIPPTCHPLSGYVPSASAGKV